VLRLSRASRLARLARSARASIRTCYATAAGYYPRTFRLSRIMGPEGASGVRFADTGEPVRTSPRAFVGPQRVAVRPASPSPVGSRRARVARAVRAGCDSVPCGTCDARARARAGSCYAGSAVA
jgi:hypothetical protein